MSHKTILDVDDGFGDRTPACREYTLPRETSDSRIYATIPGQTTIEPVLQVHITRYLDISGIEIQILSTTGNGSKSWVFVCRGENRHVEELHLNDPDHNTTSSELLEHLIGKICCKGQRTWFDKDGAIMEHQGNSCEAGENSDESSLQLFRRSYFLLKKASRMTFLLVNICQHFRGHTFEAEKLKVGHETCTSL